MLETMAGRHQKKKIEHKEWETIAMAQETMARENMVETMVVRENWITLEEDALFTPTHWKLWLCVVVMGISSLILWILRTKSVSWFSYSLCLHHFILQNNIIELINEAA